MIRGHRGHVSLVVAAVAATLLLSSCTSSASKGTSSASKGTSSAADSTSPAATSPLSSGSPSTSAARARPKNGTLPPTRPGTFTVAFAGDVHFSGRVRKRLDANPATVFGQAAAQLRTADLTMVNLETALTNRGVPQAKEYHFRAPATALTALRDAGIDVATEANNHGADYGSQGLTDTLAAISASKFPVIGIGRNAAAAFRPYTTTLNGTKVAIIAADQVQDETTLRLFSAGAHKAGVANAFSNRLDAAVHRAKAAGYVVVVYLHWGVEYQTCPSSLQTGLAARLAKDGASAVIGTHAHVLQGAGWRKDGTYVDYGLGNYLWWMSFHNNQDDNGVLTLTFRHGKVVSDHFVPSHLDSRGVPLVAHGAQRRTIETELRTDRQCAGLAATPPD